MKALDGLKPKDMVGVPWMLAFALRSDGWYLRSEIIWEKPNAMPESTRDRPTKSHETVFLLAKSQRYYYDAEAISVECSANTHARISMAPRPNARDREPGVTPKAMLARPGIRNNASFGAAVAGLVSRRNKRTVWAIPSRPFKDAHFATFPLDLPRECILAGSRAGDLIVDTFSGSGTTGLAALQLDRNYVGFEASADYCAMSRRRLRAVPGVESD